MGICRMSQEAQAGAPQSKGLNTNLGMGQEMGRRFKSEGIYVYLWMVHVEV